jgi:LysR family transcriptional activator of mexEF-oprN operon
MTHFDDIQLRRLDITLLLVFEEAMAQRKLSAAAKRLGLTQSAISHAVKRLRDVFDDELFVRTPHGVQPTPRALALRAPLAEALSLINGTIRAPTFDPARDERIFRIAASDYETALFAPLLLSSSVHTSAPRFIFRTMVRRDGIDALQTADVDLLLGYMWDAHPNCDSVTLFDEDYLVVMRRGHPVLDHPMDLQRYASCSHVLVSPGGTISGIVDKAIESVGLSRRVSLAVPYFLTALSTVARSDLIATVPRRLATRHAEDFGLITLSPPLEIRSFPVKMIWNRRLSADPALQWLRGAIQSAILQL